MVSGFVHVACVTGYRQLEVPEVSFGCERRRAQADPAGFALPAGLSARGQARALAALLLLTRERNPVRGELPGQARRTTCPALHRPGSTFGSPAR